MSDVEPSTLNLLHQLLQERKRKFLSSSQHSGNSAISFSARRKSRSQSLSYQAPSSTTRSSHRIRRCSRMRSQSLQDRPYTIRRHSVVLTTSPHSHRSEATSPSSTSQRSSTSSPSPNSSQQRAHSLRSSRPPQAPSYSVDTARRTSLA